MKYNYMQQHRIRPKTYLKKDITSYGRNNIFMRLKRKQKSSNIWTVYMYNK